jgi:predicted regulator of Ras-like GTPase activity (Roadblock/LC7/MglB family)
MRIQSVVGEDLPMGQYTDIEDILDELRKSIPTVYEATVVSRSGMHIAGDSPKGVHLETFVAMSAILLGAAETATAELKDRLQHVAVELTRSRMVLTSAGNRALLVVTASNNVSSAELAEMSKDFAERIADKI